MAMLRLDDKFIEDVGLGKLSENERLKFLQSVYGELEMRVGEKLTEGMSEDMLDEFGYFVDMNIGGMARWYEEYLPDFVEREDFKELYDANPEAEPEAILSEYGAMKWLQTNRPDYPEVVASILSEIKEEISINSEEIIRGIKGGSL
jgi:hypothetical protein